MPIKSVPRTRLYCTEAALSTARFLLNYGGEGGYEEGHNEGGYEGGYEGRGFIAQPGRPHPVCLHPGRPRPGRLVRSRQRGEASH